MIMMITTIRKKVTNIMIKLPIAIPSEGPEGDSVGLIIISSENSIIFGQLIMPCNSYSG